MSPPAMPAGSVAVNVALNSCSGWSDNSTALPPLTTTFEIRVEPTVSSPWAPGPAKARSMVRRRLSPRSSLAVTRSETKAAVAGTVRDAVAPVSGREVHDEPPSTEYSMPVTDASAEGARVSAEAVTVTGVAVTARFDALSPVSFTRVPTSGSEVARDVVPDVNVHSLRTVVESFRYGTRWSTVCSRVYVPEPDGSWATRGWLTCASSAWA